MLNGNSDTLNRQDNEKSVENSTLEASSIFCQWVKVKRAFRRLIANENTEQKDTL